MSSGKLINTWMGDGTLLKGVASGRKSYTDMQIQGVLIAILLVKFYVMIFIPVSHTLYVLKKDAY